jgi:hypothetical protein
VYTRNLFSSKPQYGAPPPEHRPEGPPPLSEAEFEEIMGRNRTVSSSAIARAVSDAAAGNSTSIALQFICGTIFKFCYNCFGCVIGGIKNEQN